MSINTTENTPAHCHDCHNFADCHQAQNMMADTEPVEGWVYDGEVYCANCDGDNDDDTPYDGESDSPTHCGGCGVPIIHELTVDGVEYVRETIADGAGCCVELWPVVWAAYDIEPHIPVDSIVMPVRFQRLCTDWHGGQDCMLYAVSSTGGLTMGTLRPGGCDSDEKWYLNIWRELSCDVCYTRRQASRPGCADPEDLTELTNFEAWVDEHVERLEESYGLADWAACDY